MRDTGKSKIVALAASGALWAQKNGDDRLRRLEAPKPFDSTYDGQTPTQPLFFSKTPKIRLKKMSPNPLTRVSCCACVDGL